MLLLLIYRGNFLIMESLLVVFSFSSPWRPRQSVRFLLLFWINHFSILFLSNLSGHVQFTSFSFRCTWNQSVWNGSLATLFRYNWFFFRLCPHFPLPLILPFQNICYWPCSRQLTSRPSIPSQRKGVYSNRLIIYICTQFSMWEKFPNLCLSWCNLQTYSHYSL